MATIYISKSLIRTIEDGNTLVDSCLLCTIQNDGRIKTVGTKKIRGLFQYTKIYKIYKICRKLFYIYSYLSYEIRSSADSKLSAVEILQGLKSEE